MQTNQKCCFRVQKKTTQQKCATYIPTLPQDKLKRNVHSSTTKKSHLTYDEKNSPMFVPNFTLNHITLHIILLPCNNIYRHNNLIYRKHY